MPRDVGPMKSRRQQTGRQEEDYHRQAVSQFHRQAGICVGLMKNRLRCTKGHIHARTYTLCLAEVSKSSLDPGLRAKLCAAREHLRLLFQSLHVPAPSSAPLTFTSSSSDRRPAGQPLPNCVKAESHRSTEEEGGRGLLFMQIQAVLGSVVGDRQVSGRT